MQEDYLQYQCFTWFWNSFPKFRKQLFHVNNKARNSIEGNRFKAMGVVKGVADFILILKNEVLFIELKTETGQQSADQKEFQYIVNSLGHQYYIIRSLEEFKELIKTKLCK